MRRPAPRPLSGALAELTGALAPPTLLARVQGAWPAVAGEALADEAEPVSERSGTVTFRCGSSVWAHELELLAPELLERLNATVGDGAGPPPVAALRFVAGGVRRPG